MRIKNTVEGALVSPAVAAEIEALYMEIADLKKSLLLVTDVLKDTVYATRSLKESRLMEAERVIR
jgi:hypothetical protein